MVIITLSLLERLVDTENRFAATRTLGLRIGDVLTIFFLRYQSKSLLRKADGWLYESRNIERELKRPGVRHNAGFEAQNGVYMGGAHAENGR